jgi:hypothetical protein
MRVKDRIKAFMQAYKVGGRKLTGTRFAAMLCTPYDTFEYWLRPDDRDHTPPGCMIAIMNILEQSAEARRLLGIDESEQASRREHEKVT